MKYDQHSISSAPALKTASDTFCPSGMTTVHQLINSRVER